MKGVVVNSFYSMGSMGRSLQDGILKDADFGMDLDHFCC
jgi:hypothetical protein